METKRLIAVAIEGAWNPKKLPRSATRLALSKSRQVLLFGVRKRNEEDTETALRLALTLLPLPLRIVVKESNILVRNETPEVSWEKDFAPELALAERGEIWVAPTLALVYDRLFLFERAAMDGGESFFLRGERRHPAPLRGLKPVPNRLIGRQKELKELEGLLEQVGVDQGQIAGISGDAGIGKTRLLSAFREKVEKSQIPCLVDHFVVGKEVPFHGLASIITGLERLLPSSGEEELNPSERDFLLLITDPGRRIERFAGRKGEELREGLHHSVRKLFLAATRKPVVLIVDDIHWADTSSVELLTDLSEVVEQTRALVVFGHRPDFSPPWSRRLNYNEIRVSPFSEQEIRELLATGAEVEHVSERLARHLTKLSTGNPFFIEELLRHLTYLGAIAVESDDDGKRSLRIREEVSKVLPTTLHALLASRFDRLSSLEREVTRWASLFGLTFSRDELSRLLQDEIGPASESALRALEEKQYFVEQSAFPQRTTRFRHDLVFDFVSRSLSREEGRARHTKIGHFLRTLYNPSIEDQITRIAHHFLEGDDDMLATSTALQAGKLAYARFHYPEAVDILRKAYVCWARQPAEMDSSEVQLPLIQALLAVGNTEEAEKILRECEKDSSDGDSSAATVQRLRLKIHEIRSEFQKVLENSERILRTLEKTPGAAPQRYEVIILRVTALIRVGKVAEALHEALAALRELNDGTYPRVRLEFWSRAAWCATVTGNGDVALDYLRKAQALVDSDTPPEVQFALAAKMGGEIYTRAAAYERSIPYLSRAVDIAEKAGLRARYRRALIWRADDASSAGSYTFAISDYQRALSEARGAQDRPTELESLARLSDVFLDLGIMAEGEVRSAELSRLSSHTDEPWLRGELRLISSQWFELKGDLKRALEERREAVREFENASDQVVASRARFHALCLEAEAKVRSVDSIVTDFDRLVQTPQGRSSSSFFFQQASTAYTLATLGGQPNPPPDPNLDPMNCPIIWLRQRLFVAKIRWLDAKLRKTAADALRETYRAERNRIAQNVPSEYLEAFHNHPLYRVP